MIRTVTCLALILVAGSANALASCANRQSRTGTESQALETGRVLDPEGAKYASEPPCCTEVYEGDAGRGCSSGLECCSNVCTGGRCACAGVGGYCFVSSDCCSGSCSYDLACCLDEAGACPVDGGNPWLDGQL